MRSFHRPQHEDLIVGILTLKPANAFDDGLFTCKVIQSLLSNTVPFCTFITKMTCERSPVHSGYFLGSVGWSLQGRSKGRADGAAALKKNNFRALI
jgi:hypothetical protein